MQFEIAHEFDIPLDALELAVVSPSLVDKLGAKVRDLGGGIETIRERTRSWKDGVLERVWHYQANIRIPQFARAYVTREMCAWDEESVYQMSRHRGQWTITPNVKPEWRKYFSSAGTYGDPGPGRWTLAAGRQGPTRAARARRSPDGREAHRFRDQESVRGRGCDAARHGNAHLIARQIRCG